MIYSIGNWTYFRFSLLFLGTCHSSAWKCSVDPNSVSPGEIATHGESSRQEVFEHGETKSRGLVTTEKSNANKVLFVIVDKNLFPFYTYPFQCNCMFPISFISDVSTHSLVKSCS